MKTARTSKALSTNTAFIPNKRDFLINENLGWEIIYYHDCNTAKCDKQYTVCSFFQLLRGCNVSSITLCHEGAQLTNSFGIHDRKLNATKAKIERKDKKKKKVCLKNIFPWWNFYSKKAISLHFFPCVYTFEKSKVVHQMSCIFKITPWGHLQPNFHFPSPSWDLNKLLPRASQE